MQSRAQTPIEKLSEVDDSSVRKRRKLLPTDSIDK
jgi:hypothetical protein